MANRTDEMVTIRGLRAAKEELDRTFRVAHATPECFSDEAEDAWRAAQLEWTTVSQAFIKQALKAAGYG